MKIQFDQWHLVRDIKWDTAHEEHERTMEPGEEARAFAQALMEDPAVTEISLCNSKSDGIWFIDKVRGEQR